MIQLPNIELLDIRNNYNVKNEHLELAIKLANERDKLINILCNDTAIDTIAFTYKYPEVTRKNINFNNYRFNYEKLEFQAGLTLKQPELEINSENESDWYDDFHLLKDDNSMDDFNSDDETEMLRELDEY